MSLNLKVKSIILIPLAAISFLNGYDAGKYESYKKYANNLIENHIKEEIKKEIKNNSLYSFKKTQDTNEKKLYYKIFKELGIKRNSIRGIITKKGKIKLKQAEEDFYYLYKYSRELKVPFEVVNWIYWNENSLRGEKSISRRYGPMQIYKYSLKDALRYLKTHNYSLYKTLKESIRKGKWKKDSETNILAGVAYLAWIRSNIPKTIKIDKLALNIYTITAYHAGIGQLNKFTKKRDWRAKDFNNLKNLNYVSYLLNKKQPLVNKKYIKKSYHYLKNFEKSVKNLKTNYTIKISGNF